MTNNLLYTKLQVPPLRRASVPRLRLLSLLDEALPRDGVWPRTLTLVSAPAGYGKTTLLSAWCARLPYPVAWLSLDRDDNDPFRFLAYLVAALQSVGVAPGADAQAMSTTTSNSNRSLMIALTNEIAAGASPFALVLDDYHLIREAAVHELVTFLLQQQPRQMHLVIATRADPPLPVPRLRGQGMLTEVRMRALRFTKPETAAFLNETMALSLSAGEAALLEERTEGWIAGLQLAALALRGRPPAERARVVSTFAGTHRYVLDYMLEEVLRSQSPAIQDFLLQTSILERLTAPLCDFLLGNGELDQPVLPRPGSQTILEHLNTHNLFLVPLDEQRRWYRYHHLFANLLRARLRARTPEQYLHLHDRASRWFEAQGFTREAITHALTAGANQRAALLVEKNALHLVYDGHLAALSRFMKALPAAIVATRPWLSVFAAWTGYWSGARDDVEEHVRTADALLAATAGVGQAEQDEIKAHLALLRAHKAIQDEDVPAATSILEEASALLDQKAPEVDFTAELASLVQGIAAWGRGDATGAEAAFRQARLIASEEGRIWEATVPACYEALQQVKQGRLADAATLLKEVLQEASVPGKRESPVAGFACVRLGDIAREWNDLEQARRYLEEGTAMCEQWGLADAVVDAYAALARLHFSSGEPAEMARALETAGALQRSTQVDPFVCTWLDTCRLRLWIYEGDFAAVRAWIGRSGLTVDGPLSFLRDLDHINLALALVALARHEADGALLGDALQLLSRLLEATEANGWVDEQIRVLLLQAVALEARAAPAGADAAVAKALELAKPGGFVRRFLEEGGSRPGDWPLLPLLYRALEHGVRPDHVGRLLQQIPQDAPPPATATVALVEPLSQRELDVLRLVAAGLSNRQIGIELSISLPTVKWHASNIYGKLGAGNRTEAVARARRLGILP